MDKLFTSTFLLILICATLFFVLYFYIYLFKQYEIANLNFYKTQNNIKRYYKSRIQISKKRLIRDQRTKLIETEKIKKHVGIAALDFLDEQGRVTETKIMHNYNFSIGRSDTNDVGLYTQTISRRHCLILFQKGKFFLCNLSQTNPTLLNGVNVKNTCSLEFGDIIEIPKYTIRFRDII